MSPTESSPVVAWLDSLIEVAELATDAPAEHRAAVLSWACSIRTDSAAMDTLMALARAGGKPARLLAAAAIYRFGPSVLDGQWRRLTFGPVDLSPKRARNI